MEEWKRGGWGIWGGWAGGLGKEWQGRGWRVEIFIRGGP